MVCTFSTPQTSKIGPNMVCFARLDSEMCFEPQRATFHLSSGQITAHPATLSSLLFHPPASQTIGKTDQIATFLPFCPPGSSFFWLFLSSFLISSPLLFSDFLFWFFLTLPIAAFHLSILSEVWLLNFFRQLHLQQHCTTLTRLITLHDITHATQHFTTLQSISLHYTRLHLQLHLHLHLHSATLTTLQYTTSATIH